jgi:GT2 family glycosyltransferase
VNHRTVAITVDYNGAEDALACVEAVSKLQPEPPLLIVVDNGTTSENQEELKRGIEGRPGVMLMRSEENLGWGRGNNLAIRWALENTECEFIYLLNSDTVAEPDSLRLLEEALDEDPEAGVSCPLIYSRDVDGGEVIWFAGGEINWFKGSVRHLGYRCPPTHPAASQRTYSEFATGCSLLIRRAVLDEVGGYDSRYFLYEEDVEFSLRITRAGHKILFLPEARVFHRVQGSHREVTSDFYPLADPRNPKLPFFLFHLNRNRLLTMITHAGASEWFRFLTVYPIYMGLKCIQWALYARWAAFGAVFRGVWDFWTDARHLPIINELTDPEAPTLSIILGGPEAS